MGVIQSRVGFQRLQPCLVFAVSSSNLFIRPFRSPTHFGAANAPSTPWPTSYEAAIVVRVDACLRFDVSIQVLLL